ncbi:putative RNase H-like nuclease [Rubricella aquisinus]|uniref:Putative RNase H-like nuclease n=1 Tax=Rubricella aquisinus TaxID=2028108 RepID=A0A840X087_9RHOB|nr:putative RNase H-like nuclease [Rubricella aquisinus]
MTIPVGIDGCKGGWLAVARQPSGILEAAILPSLLDVADRWPDPMIVVDTPVGLPMDGTRPRATDGIARRLLKEGNTDGHRSVGSRVFPAPPRPALEMWRGGMAYRDINAAMLGKKLTLQAFHILNKIDEADRQITPALQNRIREGHPELSFLEAAGKTLGPKKRSQWRHTRIALLRTLGLYHDDLPVMLGRRKGRWGTDDLLDACILIRTAQRCIAGTAQHIPETPETDTNGLRAEIWF